MVTTVQGAQPVQTTFALNSVETDIKQLVNSVKMEILFLLTAAARVV